LTARVRWGVLLAVTVLALGGALAYGVHAFLGFQARSGAASAVSVKSSGSTVQGDRVVFRNTASGAGYGMVAVVPLEVPDSARSVTDLPCDRVYAVDDVLSCLRTDAGILTTFEAAVYDAAGQQRDAWPLPGIPSRTRISPDGQLVATTSFVTGHSYAGTGFSTETVIKSVDGTDFGNLQDFTMLVGDSELTTVDRNVWGVTFADDGDTFYATAASSGSTWLMQGSLAARTLTALRSTAECPSISPDGKRVAYKKNRGTGPLMHWDITVLELASGKETVIPMEQSVDDQLEWLDDSTLLYGQPRAGAVGDSDVWAIEAAADSRPELLIEHAWSPAVVRER
jgi:hypothetical protein